MIWKILIIINLMLIIFTLFVLTKHTEAINEVASLLWVLYEKYKDTWHRSKWDKER